MSSVKEIFKKAIDNNDITTVRDLIKENKLDADDFDVLNFSPKSDDEWDIYKEIIRYPAIPDETLQKFSKIYDSDIKIGVVTHPDYPNYKRKEVTDTSILYGMNPSYQARVWIGRNDKTVDALDLLKGEYNIVFKQLGAEILAYHIHEDDILISLLENAKTDEKILEIVYANLARYDVKSLDDAIKQKIKPFVIDVVLNGDNWKIRNYASDVAVALAETIIDDFSDIHEKQDPAARKLVAYVLGEIGGNKSKSILTKLMNDPYKDYKDEYPIRDEAQKALNKIVN